MAFSLNGTNQSVSLPTTGFSFASFTLAQWVRFNAPVTGDARMWSRANGTAEANHWLMLSQTSDGSALRLRLKVNGVTNTFATGSLILSSSNGWHLIGATYNHVTGAVQQYRGSDATDIVSVMSDTHSQTGAPDSGAGIATRIGDNGSGGKNFNGSLGPVFLYDRILSLNELKALFALRGGGNNTSGLIHHWPLFRDATDLRGGWHGTLNNAPPSVASIFRSSTRARVYQIPQASEGGGGITGSGSNTLGGATVDGSGSLEIQGSGANTLGGAAADGDGSLPVIGSGGATLGGATAAGTGSQDNVGTGGASLDGASAAGSGGLTLEGNGGATLIGVTTDGSGGLPLTGTGSNALGGAAADGSGNLGQSHSGSGGAALDGGSASGSGSLPLEAAGSSALDGASVSGSGGLPISGTGSNALAGAGAAGSGTAETPTGSGGASLGGASADGSGALTLAGSGSVDLEGATGSGVGGLTLAGIGSNALSGAVAAGSESGSNAVTTPLDAASIRAIETRGEFVSVDTTGFLFAVTTSGKIQ